MGSPKLHVLVVFALVCLALSATSATSAAGDTSAQRLQSCVDRWNWMHYGDWFRLQAVVTVPAKVQASPCRVELANRVPSTNPAYKSYFSTYFPCAVNRLGAFSCSLHPIGNRGGSARAGYNASYATRSGRLTLAAPPARPVATPKPAWVRKYPVEDGFIVPYDKKGHLRAGLKIKADIGNACVTTAQPESSRFIRCASGLYCFVPGLPIFQSEPFVCPTEPGARTYLSGHLRLE